MIHLIIKHQKENIKIDTNNMETLGITLFAVVAIAFSWVAFYQLFKPLSKQNKK